MKKEVLEKIQIRMGDITRIAEEACRIALDTVCSFLERDSTLQRVIFVLYKSEHYEHYIDYFNALYLNP